MPNRPKDNSKLFPSPKLEQSMAVRNESVDNCNTESERAWYSRHGPLGLGYGDVTNQYVLGQRRR